MARSMTLAEETFLILHYSRKAMTVSEVAYKLYGGNGYRDYMRAAAQLHNLKVAGLVDNKVRGKWKNIKGRRYPLASCLSASQYKIK